MLLDVERAYKQLKRCSANEGTSGLLRIGCTGPQCRSQSDTAAERFGLPYIQYALCRAGLCLSDGAFDGGAVLWLNPVSDHSRKFTEECASYSVHWGICATVLRAISKTASHQHALIAPVNVYIAAGRPWYSGIRAVRPRATARALRLLHADTRCSGPKR